MGYAYAIDYISHKFIEVLALKNGAKEGAEAQI